MVQVLSFTMPSTKVTMFVHGGLYYRIDRASLFVVWVVKVAVDGGLDVARYAKIYKASALH